MKKMMKNKRTQIICVFFLFVLFTQITGSVLAAEETKEVDYWQKYDGVVEQVQVRMKSQLPSHIVYELGNPKLVDFKPRGYEQIDNRTVQYTADLIVDVSLNLGTNLAIENLPIQQSKINERWGIFHTCTDFGRSKTFTFEGKTYDLNRQLGFSGTFRQRDVQTQTFNLELQTRSLSVNPLNYGLRTPLELEITMNEPKTNYDYGSTQIT